MSEVKVNKISPRTNCGTVQLGDSGDTITIPAGASISNSGTASGFGSTGEVSWVTTTKTSTFTVTAGEGYFCDTSSGAFTANLPAGTAGASFAVADYTNTFQTNNLTLSPNGSQKIGGIAQDVALSTEGQSAYFVYVDDTEGWKNVIDSTSNITGNPFIIATGGTITTCGNCKIHTFTGPGTFCVSQVHPSAPNNLVGYLVVAGGGSGGAFPNGGAGGGAGGFREGRTNATTPYTDSPLSAAGHPVSVQGYPITVGAGGAVQPHPSPATGNSGSPSVFSSFTSAGGGFGTGGPSVNGTNGGSGGGGASVGSSNGNGGSGNTPPVSPPQGNNGGDGNGTDGQNSLSGGGGGAGAAGSDADASPPGPGFGGPGGNGATTHITGSPVTYAGGGGGGNQGGSDINPSGGTGGGGNGGHCSPAVSGTAGTANTGGGGGGAGGTPGATHGAAAGGSGIVIIRYKFK
tara:strand:+ start:1380 stop:2759 length:1380 start_codon:yes stop_codon:yes gene_type:complete